MTRHQAVYWAKDRIRVNCLSPGPFPKEAVDPECVERLIKKSPMVRVGRPHELKGAIVFLSSEASSYVTGQNLLVDGGGDGLVRIVGVFSCYKVSYAVLASQ